LDCPALSRVKLLNHYQIGKPLKKNFHIVRAVAIIAALVLIIISVNFGCSGDRSKSIRFEGEKLLRDAEKIFSTASIKPNLDDRESWHNIKRAYLDVTAYCWKYIDSIPADKSASERAELETIAFMAANRLSSIYFSERQYDSTIAILNQLLTFTHLKGKELLTSRLNLARAEQAKSNWTQASNIYNSIIDTFYPPIDENNTIIQAVINLPSELIRINRLIGDTNSATINIKSAQNYYSRLISDWPHTALEAAARSNLARLLADQGNYDAAIDNLRMLKDSTGQTDFEAGLAIANLTSAGKKDYPGAIAVLDEFIARTNDTLRLPFLLTQKGITYFNNKQYDKCRESMANIKDNYRRFYQYSPIPQNYYAMSFAKEGRWDLAESELRWLIENYPANEPAFNAFLTIADHYQSIGNSEMAANWFKKADEFYDKMSKENQGTGIEASALSYKAEVARRQNQWDNAAKHLLEIGNRFPDSDIGRQSLISAAAVYREKLANPTMADSLINAVRRELLPITDSKNIDMMTDDNK
jgi:tetratricopeptide (TPR) repeat protein